MNMLIRERSQRSAGSLSWAPRPGHRQFEGAGLERRVLGAQAAGGDQRLGGVVGHGGDDVGAGEEGAEAVELRHRQDHLALAAEFLQFLVDEAAEVAGEGHQRVRSRAVVVEGQLAGRGVGAEDLRLAAAHGLALGVGRQFVGVADAHRYLPEASRFGINR